MNVWFLSGIFTRAFRLHVRSFASSFSGRRLILSVLGGFKRVFLGDLIYPGVYFVIVW